MMNTRFISEILYQLKKDYGDLLNYIQINDSSFDTNTGARTISKVAYCFPAVILPRTTTRKFIQDIGYLAANKNFTYGAVNDYTQLQVIIEGEDLPKTLNMSLNGYIVFGHKRYEKTEFELLSDGVAYLLTMKAVEGSRPYDIMNLKVHNSLQLYGGVSFDLN